MKKPQNILVITYWPLNNALITTYTLPYLRLILKKLPAKSRIWLFTLSAVADRRSPEQNRLQKDLKKENIESVDFTYQKFGFSMLLRSAYILLYLPFLIFRKKIDVVHAWCTPGGAIGWLISVLTGKSLVLDSFEPHAESMVETGTWKKKSFAYRLLLWLEKKQLQRAKHVISAAQGMTDYVRKTYGVKRQLDLVKPACVDLEKFRSQRRADRSIVPMLEESDIVCVYAGKFGGIYLEKETFEFFSESAEYWPGRFKVLLLTSHSQSEIDAYCQNSGFNKNNLVRLFVPHEEVPRYMALGDFGICPVKPIPTKRFCSPIKNGEYWALGLPVVITDNISNDSALIRQYAAGAVLEGFDHSSYKAALQKIDALLNDPGHKTRIRELAENYRNYSIAEKIYAAIYA